MVIRLGALGDLVFCFQSFCEIRHAHPEARIALLTRAPFADFARTMPWFDEVILETHPEPLQWGAWAKLVKSIRSFAPTRIYDLQGKRRQSILYALLGGPLGPEWSGAAPFCKFPRLWPPAPGMSFAGFLAAQLRAAAVPIAPPVDLSWLDASTENFSLPEHYVALVPGCSPGAVYKRWPPKKYAELAQALHARGQLCVIVGTNQDRESAVSIKQAAPAIIDLCGKTNLHELAAVLRCASSVIGNDTGPVHMAAAVGAPTLALFSGRGNPVWSKPPGKKTMCLQREALSDLSVADVLAAVDQLV